METIPKDEVCRMICKYCIKVNKFCQHRWDCPLLTEIAKYKDEQTDCTEALTLLWIKNMVTDEEFYRIDARLKVMPQTERSE